MSRDLTAAALKSLDIPFSFYDESFTNFFGSRAALILYEKSATAKRADLKELLRQITVWRLGLFILDGALVLPAGMTISDLRFEWIPAGTPWWNPSQEVRADIMAIEAGLRTRTEIRKEKFGDDWEQDVLPQIKREQTLIADNQIALTTPDGSLFAPDPIMVDHDER